MPCSSERGRHFKGTCDPHIQVQWVSQEKTPAKTHSSFLTLKLVIFSYKMLGCFWTWCYNPDHHNLALQSLVFLKTFAFKGKKLLCMHNCFFSWCYAQQFPTKMSLALMPHISHFTFPIIHSWQTYTQPWNLFFFIYLIMPLVSRLYSMKWQDDRWIGKSLDGSVGSIIKALSRLPWGTEESHKNFSQDSQSPGSDLNHASPDYKFRTLLLCQPI
jgi:hypothetical protein